MTVGETRVLRAKVQPPRAVGLRRERLDRLIGRAWDRRLTVVIGPAGSGKSTLLAQFCDAPPAPVVWFRAEPTDRSAEDLLSHLAHSLPSATTEGIDAPASADDFAAQIQRSGLGRFAVVIDDVHHIAGSDAERCLARLIDCLPPDVSIVTAGRELPAIHLSRLRVEDELVEIGPDELRFRSWEVEQLFVDVYRSPLPPEDSATLALRTEGWAAGLQLFHLATEGQSASRRRNELDRMSGRGRLLHEYLAQNVLAGLSEPLRHLLVHTSVLGRISGPLCDELLGTTGSASALAELERRQLFTVAVDEGVYRYHEVFRAHLESLLVDELGEQATREMCVRAGGLLEAHGWPAEAVRAYCRAGREEEAAKLLGSHGEQVADSGGPWLDHLPSGLRDHDPWLLLGAARRSVSEGRWPTAAALYHQAEAGFTASVPASACRRERRALLDWIEPSPSPAPGWSGVLRTAVRRWPLLARDDARALDGPFNALIAGFASLLGGQLHDARRALQAAHDGSEATEITALAARFGLWLTDRTSGVADDSDLERIALDADRLELRGLARLADTILNREPEDRHPAVVGAPGANGDWPEAVAAIVWGLDHRQQPDAMRHALDQAADAFRAFDAGTLEAWARALTVASRARAGDPEAVSEAIAAESFARAAGVLGAQVVCLAVSASGEDQRPDRADAWRAMAAECGIDPTFVNRLTEGPASVREQPRSEPAPNGTHSTLRVLGSFELTVDGRPVDLSGIKPRARSVLRLLALHAPDPVHREVIIESLWPDADRAAGTRNLQVALSSLRRQIEPEAARGEASVLIRDGDAYRLVLGDDDNDVRSLRRAVTDAMALARSTDAADAVRALESALAGEPAELLPEEGPADWVVTERHALTHLLVDGIGTLVDLLRREGDLTSAARWCEQGLRLDPYRDALWRSLIAAFDELGDRAASARARKGYDDILAELGLEPLTIGADVTSS